MFGQVVGERDGEALRQPGSRGIAVDPAPCRAGIVQRVREDVRAPELRGERDGALAPGKRRGRIVAQHGELSEVGKGHCQFGRRLLAFEDRQRLARVAVGLGTIAVQIVQPRQPAQAVAFRDAVAAQAVDLDCGQLRRDGLAHLADEMQLEGAFPVE